MLAHFVAFGVKKQPETCHKPAAAANANIVAKCSAWLFRVERQ
jgi:hypothetical protein